VVGVPYTLNFEFLHIYDAAKPGISVPIELRFGGRVVTLTAKLDTGASFCIFARAYAEALGLDIERGMPEWVGTATNNRFLTYGHNVTLSTLNFEFDTIAYFAADEGFRRNVLGRRGWLERLRISLIDYDGALYITTMNEADTI
jgi:hypothetical protein